MLFLTNSNQKFQSWNPVTSLFVLTYALSLLLTFLIWINNCFEITISLDFLAWKVFIIRFIYLPTVVKIVASTDVVSVRGGILFMNVWEKRTEIYYGMRGNLVCSCWTLRISFNVCLDYLWSRRWYISIYLDNFRKIHIYIIIPKKTDYLNFLTNFS